MHRYGGIIQKIQKDTKKTLPSYLCMFTKGKQKKKRSFKDWSPLKKMKAGLQSCRSTYRGSGIAFRYKQQHRSPRRTYNIIKVRALARTCINIHTIGILVSHCFVTLLWNLPDFCKSKQSAFKTLFHNVRTPPHLMDISRREHYKKCNATKHDDKYGCKITTKNWYTQVFLKKKALFAKKALF